MLDETGFSWPGGFFAGDSVLWLCNIKAYVISIERIIVPKGEVPIKYIDIRGIICVKFVPPDSLEKI